MPMGAGIKQCTFANFVIILAERSQCRRLRPLEEQAVNLHHHPPAAMEVNVTAKLVFDCNLLFTILDNASFITAMEKADLFLLRTSNITLR